MPSGSGAARSSPSVSTVIPDAIGGHDPGQVPRGLGPEDRDVLPGELVPVAERAVRDDPTEQLGQAGLVGQRVADAGGQHDPARGGRPRRRWSPRSRLRPGRPSVAVASRTVTVSYAASSRRADEAELGRRGAVVRHDVVHVVGRVVAVAAGVEHQDPAVHPPEGEGGLQSGGAAADHDRVLESRLLEVAMWQGCDFMLT